MNLTSVTFSIALTFLLAVAQRPHGQSAATGLLLYNSFNFGPNGLFIRLGQVNADGTGDQLINLNLPNPLFPAVSRDGQLLALTANDPLRPNKISPDVFVVNRQSGRIDKLTAFEDFANLQGFTIIAPFWKAFSPDGQRLAVAGYYYFGARGTLVYTNDAGQQVGPYQPLSSVQSAPALAVYHANGAAPIAVDSGLASDQDLSHRGEGLDWSPVDDRLAYPRTFSTATQIGSPIVLTSIHLLQPVANAGAGNPTRVTTPMAVSGVAPFDNFVLAWADDFFPAFSPNARGLAYVRAYSVATFAGVDFITPSIRIANLDGSGDFEVIRFQRGAYITHISWSPDGTRLVFDLGAQSVSGGFPAKSANPNTLELYMVNVNGSGLTRIHSASASHPVWVSGGGNPPVAVPVIEGLEPKSIAAGANGLELTVQGNSFSRDAVVRWNNVDLPTTFISANQLRASISAAQLAQPGAKSISVFNPGATGGLSNLAPFTVNEADSVVPPNLVARFVRDVVPSIVITWPATGNVVVEESDHLGPQANWRTAAATPLTGGGQSSVTLTPSQGARFFRLRQP